MFYSQFILAKKGPLGTIWIAAHLERKLRKNQVADTDIGVSVDSILSPDVPIALRLSSHLLLGVVRIYNRKVNYLFDDCSDALLKIKQAFRSAAVDLPPEESKAPYHSITLPETFDLDDFELPDNDIFQGNFVDHHISSREQITLQDTMEGVSYSTSKFGLDERFGDGDASGLDLDEELFLNKIGTTEHADERSAPQTSFGSMTPLKEEEHPETSAVNSETKVDDANDHADLMDYAQAPSTPGLLEEPNLSNVKEVSACEDHMELEYHATEVTESAKNTTGDKQEVGWHSRDNTDSVVLTEDHQSVDFDIDLSKTQGESPIEANTEHISMDESSPGSKLATDLLGQVEAQNPALELADQIIDTTEDLQNGSANKDDNSSLPIDKPSDHHQGYEIGLEESGCGTSDLASTSNQVSEVVSVDNQRLLEVEVPGSEEMAIHLESCPDASDLASKNQDGSFLQDPEIPAFHEPIDSSSLNLDVPEKVASTETFVLRPCNSNVEQHDLVSVISTDADVKSDGAALATSGRETTVMLDTSEEILKENDKQDHTSREDVHTAPIEPENEQLNNTNSHDNLVENLNYSAEAELPAPEKLLSVVEGPAHQHKDMLVDGTPGVFTGFDEGDAGSKIVSGKKRSFTESTLTEQSLNSVESSRLVRFKRTVESVPDDDDLLSSILVGRSSVLKVKPTPRLSEVTSMKRTRSAPRTGGPKRKVLMDDTMVLHGDTIRLQLTSTEDIRRVRKKAPCTLPEISSIQKQHLEDEIFLQPAFTGMSPELRSLHSQTCDLSRITVCKSDPIVASLDTVAELKLPSETVPPENDENVISLEQMDEKVLASHDVKDEDSLTVADKPHLTSQNAGNDESLDIENLNTSGGPNATEQSLVQIMSEPLLDGNTEVAEPRENPNLMDEADVTNAEINASKDANLSQQDLLLDVTGVGTSSKNEDAVNSPVTAEVESLYSTKEVWGDASADMAQPGSITETNEMNPFVNADMSYDEKMDAPYVEFDSAMMYSDNVQAVSEFELTDKDGENTAAAETEPLVRDDGLSEVAGDGVNVELLSNSQDRELEYNKNTELKSGMYEDSFMNNDEVPEQPEAYERYVLDGESSGFDLHNQEELEYAAAAHNTDFLNVDDDELDEIADDHISDDDDDESRFTETTGWSSRTRAVSKYLQTLFVKEAERGRSYVSMDNLLSGKSRKEASRMFFETLVLKTRDHIHVEQPAPFDDIAIRPRTRLTKYDF